LLVAAEARGFELSGESTPLRELLRDLWASRDLVAMLARKEFFVRYRRASLGMLWAVLLPLFQTTVLVVVFSRIVRFETKEPYAVFVFPAYMAWTYFSTALPSAATAIVDNANLSSRVYFPRAVLPITAVVSNLYNFAFTMLALAGVCAISGVFPGWRVLLLFPASVLLVALTAALALLISGLHVYFRDLRFVLQAVISPLLFLTPVLYPLDQTPDRIKVLVGVNPMSGVAELFRAAITGEESGWGGTVLVSVAWGVGAPLLGLRVQRRYTRVFSDLL